jgi:hypothetical protein
MERPQRRKNMPGFPGTFSLVRLLTVQVPVDVVLVEAQPFTEVDTASRRKIRPGPNRRWMMDQRGIKGDQLWQGPLEPMRGQIS